MKGDRAVHSARRQSPHDLTMAQNVVVPPFDVAPETVVGATPQSVFTFDFPFWNAADIRVRVDGVELLPSAFTVEGFFIQNGDPVEGGFGSGRVTLNTAIANCTVTLDRFVVDARESQFGRSSPLPMPALNADLNKATARDQDISRLARKAVDLAERTDVDANRAEQAAAAAEAARDDTVSGLGAKANKDLANATVELGSASRSALDKLGEVVSIEDFGGIPNDNAVDNRTALQDAVDYLAAGGGGTVFIPRRRYRMADTGAVVTWASNVRLVGDGYGSEIFHDDRPTNPRKDLIDFSGAKSWIVENLAFVGTVDAYPEETNQSQCLVGYSGIENAVIRGVRFYGLRYMATAFRNPKRIAFFDNDFERIVRDGVRCINAQGVVVIGNRFRDVADDAVALHSGDSETVPGSGFIVSGNLFEACQGIKALGAKIISVKNNTFRRTLRGPIEIRTDPGNPEGNTVPLAIDVSDNLITDTFMSLGRDAAVQVLGPARRTGGAPGKPGQTTAPYDYAYLNNTQAVGPVPGMFGVRIANNRVMRTLGNVAKMSDWGHGPRFDRATPGFWSDPAITDASFTGCGIRVRGPVADLDVSGNLVRGQGRPLELIVEGASNGVDIQGAVERNTFIDFTLPVRLVQGSGVGSYRLSLRDNVFDGDPYFKAAGHNANNTWANAGNLPALVTDNGVIGVIASGNQFSNVSTTGLTNGDQFLEPTHPNIVYSDFVAHGDDAGNKGVRLLPISSVALIVPIYGDPAAVNYGQIRTLPKMVSGGMPTSGRYVYGHFCRKSYPATAGSAGSVYAVTGWWRVTTGEGHVAGTDWLEMRVLTGS